MIFKYLINGVTLYRIITQVQGGILASSYDNTVNLHYTLSIYEASPKR